MCEPDNRHIRKAHVANHGNHLLRHGDLVQKQRHFAANLLAVAQFDVHGQGVVLECLDFVADAAEVGSEPLQHVLHVHEHAFARCDLLEQCGDVVGFPNVWGQDRAIERDIHGGGRSV